MQERNSWQFHIEVNQSCENTEGQSHIKPFASFAPRVSALIQEVQKDVITFNSAIAACDEVNNSDSLVLDQSLLHLSGLNLVESNLVSMLFLCFPNEFGTNSPLPDCQARNWQMSFQLFQDMQGRQT